ncbi:crosslink repair DNA glycosylase YcaQ family protein [Tsukamurella sp. 8F]|uniref:winged helix-turn-helix domain-containing protein n=1 Tax=unclassified Tsukamurella TaxID=2633480 RepID=UPI0023B9087A|nr:MULTISPECIES: crosslink repair DNA glycosylase YcaQ family protein [unclassified Tsukamurella]MDF0531486.1 crosslink repair DNA glycosylase YcaQ family protein [Tsukamurella sp. 8J]MDF0588730.1 crosslink repair DNA glycosylase YcaQ family protein [Tsukamurella sp. 8F]
MRISREAARRIALAAQGFESGFAGSGEPTMRHVQKVIDRLRLLQIDSVNVVTRSQYLPVYSRLGAYDPALLDRARDRSPRRLVETWAHEASLVPPDVWPLLRYRHTSARNLARVASFEARHPGMLDRIRGELATQPPLTARELEAQLEHDQIVEKTHWGWNWSAVKEGLETLFRIGEVTSAGRTQQFERRYALTKAVLPELPDIDPDDAIAELVRQSARAVGIGSVRCIRDYFRLSTAEAAPGVEEMLRSGELLEVDVPGGHWQGPVYVHAEARRPRRIDARALLSPFDPVVWQRERARALFDFRYRIEIYTPKEKRVHGYYVLPFLLGDRLVARCDLKADRIAGTLLVHQVTWEPGAHTQGSDDALDAELATFAGWLGLATVTR